MKYIKVTNYVENVNRLSLEKLGMSTKRENDQTIGQFGSGIKFAPIAAIRKGMRWVFTGKDNKGDYVLEYIIKDDEGIPSVFYKYQDYEKPSSFTADAGILSWKEEFQIYREVVSNAIDENTLNGLGWDVDVVDVEEIVPVDGEFSVYITATEELLEIHNNFDKYFCVNRTPIYSDDWFKVYEPIDDSFRVYCKGVLVFSSEKNTKNYGASEQSGIFDYEINTLDLNEDRTVDGNFALNYKILSALVSIRDKNIINTIIQYLISKENLPLYELQSISSYVYQNVYVNNYYWKEVFEEQYEKSVIVYSGSSSYNLLKTIESKGYNAVEIKEEGVFSLMQKLAIPSVQTIFGESLKYEYSFDLTDYPVIVKAMEMCEFALPEMKGVKEFVGVYTPLYDDDNAIAMTINIGEDDELKRMILVNRDFAFKNGVEDMIGTIVHEWDHLTSSVGDGDTEGRMFRDLADKKIGYLICKLYKLTHK